MILPRILKDPVERTRFLRFALVGTIGALVDFATFNLLIKFFPIDPVLANVVSFSVAVISNFTWNRYWTYPDSRSKPLSRQLVEFAVVNILGVGIRTPIFAFLSAFLINIFSETAFLSSMPILTPELLGNNLALAVAIVFVMFWNFFINRYWTYNDVK
ncbi:MAG: GtrA family protein [Chloroflexi bacterium]|nr:GtrA family protein [Chloroflexota bacterium]